MPDPTHPETLLAEAAALEGASAQEVLAFAETRFASRAAIASSFGPEDIVLLHLAREHAPSLRVFTLDTGRLHPETYELMEAVRLRLGLELEVFAPVGEALERLVSEQGLFSFRRGIEERKACCHLRKVEPLRRALSGRAAWLTGLRRDQSVTRTAVARAGWDEGHGLLKLNPLADWSQAEIWAHLRDHGLPYNALHDRGFPSVGCAPCTRAVRPWEDERAGRWWWESPEGRECGLHVRT